MSYMFWLGAEGEKLDQDETMRRIFGKPVPIRSLRNFWEGYAKHQGWMR